MKKIIAVKNIILSTVLLILLMNSCKNEPGNDNPKELEIDINEEKIQNEQIYDDADVLADIVEINLSEIEMGKLAILKGSDQGVIKYGRMIVTDHTKALEELKVLANKNTIALPTSITDEGNEKYNKLNEKSGADFDKNFIIIMTDGREKAVDKMTEISQKATDKDIQFWASRQISTLISHQEVAKQLKEKMN